MKKKVLKILISLLILSNIFILSSCDNATTNVSNTNTPVSEKSENNNIIVESKGNEELQEDLRSSADILSVLPNALNIDAITSSENDTVLKEDIKVNIDIAYDNVYTNKPIEIQSLLDSEMFFVSLDVDGNSRLNYKGDATKYNCLYFLEGQSEALALTDEDIKVCLYNMLLMYSSHSNHTFDMYSSAEDVFQLKDYNVYNSIIGKRVEDLKYVTEVQLGTKLVNEYELNFLKIKALKDTNMIVESEISLQLDSEDSMWQILTNLGYEQSILRATREEEQGIVYVDIFEGGELISDFENTDIMWQHPDGYMVYIKILEDGNVKIKETLYYYDALLPLFNAY